MPRKRAFAGITRRQWGQSPCGLCKCTLDRLRCHWSIKKDEDEAEYFAQWDRLFTDIENHVNGNATQYE